MAIEVIARFCLFKMRSAECKTSGQGRHGGGKEETVYLEYLLLGQDIATASVVACRLWHLAVSVPA